MLTLTKHKKDTRATSEKIQTWENFMDLGSFREDQRIPVLALIDVWQELYKHDEDGIDAIAILHELTSRNLANLVMTR